MNKEYLTHIFGITTPSLMLDEQGNYFYNEDGPVDSTYYSYALSDIRANDYDTINYAYLKKIAVDYYNSFLKSYFDNGLFIQEDDLWSTVTIDKQDEILNKNIKREHFKIAAANGNVGLRNAMLIIDTNGKENPSEIMEKTTVSPDLGAIGFQGDKGNFRNVIPSKYIKEVMIKDPYLGDIIIKNPNYLKNNELDANELYNEKIKEIEFLYSNCQLKGSIKMFDDLINEVVSDIGLLNMPDLYKRKLYEYADDRRVMIKEELSSNTLN